MGPELTREGGIAFVTGASRGIGAAIAEALAAEGWPVGVNYRSDEVAAAEVVARIAKAGGTAVAVHGDVADRKRVDEMFSELEERLGRVLVLVNSAGVRRDKLTPTLSEEEWAEVVDVNMSAAYRTMHRALPVMLRARFGRIINISSISANRPMPGQLSYAASKAGLEAMTRTTAVEVARRGVTVNAIAPGMVETDMTAQMDKSFTRGIPIRRAGSPAEVAACATFLASPGACYVTGTTLVVDGGLSAGMSAAPVSLPSSETATVNA